MLGFCNLSFYILVFYLSLSKLISISLFIKSISEFCIPVAYATETLEDANSCFRVNVLTGEIDPNLTLIKTSVDYLRSEVLTKDTFKSVIKLSVSDKVEEIIQSSTRISAATASAFTSVGMHVGDQFYSFNDEVREALMETPYGRAVSDLSTLISNGTYIPMYEAKEVLSNILKNRPPELELSDYSFLNQKLAENCAILMSGSIVAVKGGSVIAAKSSYGSAMAWGFRFGVLVAVDEVLTGAALAESIAVRQEFIQKLIDVGDSVLAVVSTDELSESTKTIKFEDREFTSLLDLASNKEFMNDATLPNGKLLLKIPSEGMPGGNRIVFLSPDEIRDLCSDSLKNV